MSLLFLILELPRILLVKLDINFLTEGRKGSQKGHFFTNVFCVSSLSRYIKFLTYNLVVITFSLLLLKFESQYDYGNLNSDLINNKETLIDHYTTLLEQLQTLHEWALLQIKNNKSHYYTRRKIFCKFCFE